MAYAYVKADQVVKILNTSQPFTDPATEIQHSSNIFSLWTDEEKAKIGLYPVQQSGMVDNNFYTQSATTYNFDKEKNIVYEVIESKEKNINDVNEVDADGKPLLDDKGKQVVTKGLKSIWIETTKKTAYNLLLPTDWYIIRNVEDNTQAIPSDVVSFRKNVKTACTTIETAINNCDTLEKIKTLFIVPVDSEGKVTGNAPINDFPEPYES